MHFPVVLLAVVLAFVAADVSGDVNDCQESSPLCDRLGQLERLLIGQSRLLGQLQSKLSHQEELNNELVEKLSYQDVLIHQLQSTVSRQGDQLSEQAELLDHLRAEKARDSAELEALKQKLNSMFTDTDFKTATQNLGNSPAGLKSSVLSVTRDVRPRSDDAGPLEVVVSQMSQRMTEMSADVQAMKNSYQVIQDAQSSTFVHWGSSQCSNDSQLVYSGVVGGSFQAHPGSGTNYLCLTMSPVISNHSIPSAVALLYGGEYETYDAHMNKDPVCAVCLSRHSTTIMIPGTNVCTPGWHQHYSGFLMAGYYNQVGPSEFVCVDPSFESRVGGDTSHDGKLFYFTVTDCGSLPCEPYVDNKIVTCVVCSK